MAKLRDLVSGAATFLAVLCQTTSASAAVADDVAQDPVKLTGYGSFTGTTLNSTISGHALPAPVDAWLGIDYATQPTGPARRFRPVGPPKPFTGVRAASAYGKACIQDAAALDVDSQDEACLYLNVFRTAGVARTEKLPVLVWVHGGAFVAGSYRMFDGASFAASSTEPVVVVNFHYRLGALGSLPSRLFRDEGLLNLGLRDQRELLTFVQRHISSFGGDPDRVTLGGQSAGAHSVGIHYSHNYAGEEEEKPLFARVIHQSGSVTARSFPNATDPLCVEQMNQFMSHLGCPQDDKNKNNNGSDDAATLECLRTADVGAIRSATVAVYSAFYAALTWPFQPTQGGPLFEKYGSVSGREGTFHRVPSLNTHVTNEGNGFVPGDLETDAQFLDYFRNSLPELTEADISLLRDLYPDPVSDPSSPYHRVDFPGKGAQFSRLATAWGDYAYICPVQETAHVAASVAGLATWKARFDTNSSFPAWQGIPHSADAQYAWDEPSAQHRDVARLYHGYFSSFVASGDPNKHRHPGSPAWPAYEPAAGDGSGASALQLVVRPGSNGTRPERDDRRSEQCLYWRDPERAARLHK